MPIGSAPSDSSYSTIPRHYVRNNTCNAFIASRVDYCNTVLAGSPRFITDRLQRMLNAAARVITGSLTTACLICSTLSYIGWTSINVFSIKSESQFISASRIVLPSTWWTAVCICLMFPVVSACSQPISVSWSCHDTVAASSNVDRSLLQLQWSGTRFQTLFGTQCWGLTTSDRH